MGIIGECGGNVVSVDVQEVEGTLAVDELVVDLPDDVDGDTLRTRLDDDRAGILLSIQGARPYSDMVLRAMQWTEALLESRQSERSDMLRARSRTCARPLTRGWPTRSPSRASSRRGGTRWSGSTAADRTDSIPVGIAPISVRARGCRLPDHESEPLRVRCFSRSAAATPLHRDRDRPCCRIAAHVSDTRPAERQPRSASSARCSRRRPLRFRRLLVAALLDGSCAPGGALRRPPNRRPANRLSAPADICSPELMK